MVSEIVIDPHPVLDAAQLQPALDALEAREAGDSLRRRHPRMARRCDCRQGVLAVVAARQRHDRPAPAPRHPRQNTASTSDAPVATVHCAGSLNHSSSDQQPRSITRFRLSSRALAITRPIAGIVRTR